MTVLLYSFWIRVFQLFGPESNTALKKPKVWLSFFSLKSQSTLFSSGLSLKVVPCSRQTTVHFCQHKEIVTLWVWRWIFVPHIFLLCKQWVDATAEKRGNIQTDLFLWLIVTVWACVRNSHVQLNKYEPNEVVRVYVSVLFWKNHSKCHIWWRCNLRWD